MAYKQRTDITTATQSILTDDPDFLRILVERVIQEILEAEMTAHLHADPYEHSAERRGYRTGTSPANCIPASARSPCRCRRIGTGRSRRNSSPATSGVRRRSFAATTREQALTMAEAVTARWQSTRPAVARLLEEAIEDCLACLAFPLAHRARIRTTNGMERLDEEIKRRTRMVRIFPNTDACLRLVAALCVEQSEEWVSGRCYLEMSELVISHTRESERAGDDGGLLTAGVSPGLIHCRESQVSAETIPENRPFLRRFSDDM